MSGRAVAALRAAGVRTLFATNNSAPTRAELHARLANCGITDLDATFSVRPTWPPKCFPVGSTALMVADDGVREALTNGA